MAAYKAEVVGIYIQSDEAVDHSWQCRLWNEGNPMEQSLIVPISQRGTQTLSSGPGVRYYLCWLKDYYHFK